MGSKQKRLFEEPKIEYTIRSLKSLIKSINFCNEKYPSIKIKLMIIDDNSKQENLKKITTLAKNSNLKTEILNLDHHKYKNVIKEQKNEQTFSNLASLLCCYEKVSHVEGGFGAMKNSGFKTS